MADLEALRQTALQDSEPLGTKSRFGLFSHPISTAVGDNGPYQRTFHPRDENGKPVTQPRNFQSGPGGKGQLSKSYFGGLNSLSASGTKDQYIDPDRKLLLQENEKFYASFKNQNKYKPPSGTGENILWRASYPYIEEKPTQKDPKRNREEDGRVKTGLKNVTTNLGSKISTTLYKHEKHLDDPYDRAHILELQKMKKDKALEGESSFKPNCFVSKPFNKDIKVYGEDVQLKPKTIKEAKFNIHNHDSNWKGTSPNKHGLYGYFTPFPAYKGDPIRVVKRKDAPENAKQNFKLMNSSILTKQSPSIMTSHMNMRRYVSQSFNNKRY